MGPPAAGRIVILNGAPRSGKTAIARAMQEHRPGAWLNLGVDVWTRALPERFRPGIGLRPGGERPDLEDLVFTLYAALWDAVAALARRGLDTVVDVGLHDDYSAPGHIARDAARRLAAFDVLVVGVRCPLDVVWQRRRATWGQARGEANVRTVAAVERWQSAVHDGFAYDLEIDTSSASPAQCAAAIVTRLAGPAGTCLALAGST